MNDVTLRNKLNHWAACALAFFVLQAFVPAALAWNWPGLTPLTTDSASLDQKVVRDGAGNAMAVWDDEDGVIPDGLLASVYTLGGGWSSAYAIVPVYDGFGPSPTFDIAMNDGGDFIVASGAIHLLLGDRIVADLYVGGVLVSNDFVISTNLAALATNSLLLKVAMSGNGDALVAWDNGAEIRYRMYRGGSWGADSVLDSGSDIDSLDVAADESGNFTVVWKPTSTGVVYGRRFLGGTWNARETVGTGVALYGPRVTMFGTGEALVAWQDPSTSPVRIRVRRFNGTAWLTTATVDAGTGFGSARNPQIASQPDGTAMVVFTQGTSAPNERVYANRFSSGTWGSAQEISCGFLAHNLNVDLDGNGNAAAAMLASDTILYRAYADGLGWLGCSAQGVGGQSGVENILADRIGKRVVINGHEIHAIFRGAGSNAGPYVGKGNKDVYINGFDTETTNPTVDLDVTLPFNDICGNVSPFFFTEMRFSNDGVSWAPWEAGPPTTAPYQVTRTGWDITNLAYGGDANGGLKRVYIQYRNANCVSLVTHDDINYVPPAVIDLAITKTDTPDPVWLGDNLVYDITVSNFGPDGATGVTVTDQLPASVTVSSSTASQGSCAPPVGNVVTCNLGALAASGVATISITVVPTASGDISNTAQVSANETDSNGTNNTATETTTVLVPNTPPGTDVVVNPDPDITMTFSEVTDPGDTTVTSSATDPGPGGAPYDFHGMFYDFNTTATYTGTIEICFTYDDAGLTFAQEAALRILHLVNGVWVDVTTSLDTTNNIICGTVTSLSWFGVGEVMDTDGDGVGDDIDNCTLVPNTNQRDTDGDNFGNMCDGDLNNDNLTNTLDFGLFKQAFGTTGANIDADFNGDQIVNTLDFGLFKQMFGQPPGPSGLAQ